MGDLVTLASMRSAGMVRAVWLGGWLGLVGACSRPPTTEIHSEAPVAPTTAVASVAPVASSAEVGATRKPDEATDEEGKPTAEQLAAMPDVGRVTSTSGQRTAWLRRGVELWIKDPAGERQLVPGGALKVANPDANLPPLEQAVPYNLSFSPDEQRLYFQRDGWATSSALFYVEVATGKVFFFHDANGYQVIHECRDRAQLGRVITFEHSYFDIYPMSAADLFFLVDGAAPKAGESRTGQSGRVGPIGFEEENVARFLHKVCGVGKAPASPKRQEIPAKLRASSVRCDGRVMKRDDLRLLDGTTQVRFRFASPDQEPAEVWSLATAIEACVGP